MKWNISERYLEKLEKNACLKPIFCLEFHKKKIEDMEFCEKKKH